MTTTRPATYIAANTDGSYDAFVSGKGFRANSTLSECTRFVRENSSRRGPIPMFDRKNREWESELEISEGA